MSNYLVSTQHPTWRLWTSAHPDYDYSYCTRTGRIHPDDERLHEVLATTVRVNAEMQVARYGSGLNAARIEDEPVARSKAKPHNLLAGYVCERKLTSQGYLVLFDTDEANLAPGWDGIKAQPCRWVVCWLDHPDARPEPFFLRGPDFTSQRAARAFLKHECKLAAEDAGDYDWGDGLRINGEVTA